MTIPEDALLREVARCFVQAQKSELACCGGVSHTQCTLLTLLGRHGALSQRDIGRLTGLEKSWVSRAVERLVAQGWATKAPNDHDARSVVVRLSELGQTAWVQLEARLNAHAAQVVGRVAPAEQPAVRRALRLLYDALQRGAVTDEGEGTCRKTA